MNPKDSTEVVSAMIESRAIQIIEEFDSDDDCTRLLDKRRSRNCPYRSISPRL